MSGNRNKLIAFNYFGGKFTWTDHLYQNFPVGFTHLIDVFAGSLCVSLNYHGNVIRTANEINGEVTNFFAQIRDHEEELLRLLQLTPCSELEYRNCWGASEISDLERARRFYVRVRQSFFGLGVARENKGFHMAKQHVNTKGGETVSRWYNGVEKLHEVAAEIRRNFQIINGSYADCIDRLDFPGAFFYCDPPYPEECRNSKNGYRFEFTDDDHRTLAERLHRFFVYCLVKEIDDALVRLNAFRELHISPFAQPYRDFENKVEPTAEQKRMAWWCNQKQAFYGCEFKNFNPHRRNLSSTPQPSEKIF